jgi:hypothetical protein
MILITRPRTERGCHTVLYREYTATKHTGDQQPHLLRVVLSDPGTSTEATNKRKRKKKNHINLDMSYDDISMGISHALFQISLKDPSLSRRVRRKKSSPVPTR